MERVKKKPLSTSIIILISFLFIGMLLFALPVEDNVKLANWTMVFGGWGAIQYLMTYIIFKKLFKFPLWFIDVLWLVYAVVACSTLRQYMLPLSYILFIFSLSVFILAIDDFFS